MIVFCTTCKGRAQHIEQTLPKNLIDNADFEDCKFVILDYNSPDHLIPFLKQNHQRDIDAGRLVVYQFPFDGPFRMAHAKNMVHRLGLLEGADTLVNLDADNFTGPGFAQYVQDRMSGQEFLWARMMQPDGSRLARGCSGRIVVNRHQFLNTGGYDEKYETWSPDDKDFNARLCRLGYSGQEIEPQYLNAVLHNDKMRFREYRHVKTGMGEDSFKLDDCGTTVVNQGRIGTGLTFRNFATEPIEIEPLPTRIFGIGMHKTATTSLHTALKILGFDSAHWKSAHWAKAIWQEMTTEGRSLTLEKSYALCDLPIPILYRELDGAYPGSKFILTIRYESEWIESIRKHWSHEHNRFRAGWNHDPFTHKVHKLLYGQKGFDAELFLNRYRRHNDEVLKYFAGRPQDLHVMEMSRFPGWNNLCHFLNRPVPKVPYPWKFKTSTPALEGDYQI